MASSLVEVIESVRMQTFNINIDMQHETRSHLYLKGFSDAVMRTAAEVTRTETVPKKMGGGQKGPK
jgi:hypothetical protein